MPKVYKSNIDLVRAVYKKTGTAGFYDGVTPALLAIGPYMALNFAIYGQLKAGYAWGSGRTVEESTIVAKVRTLFYTLYPRTSTFIVAKVRSHLAHTLVSTNATCSPIQLKNHDLLSLE
jgi:hypothetical protein